MYTRFLFTAVTAGFIAGSASAQTFQQRAVFTGGGNRDEGQCVIEVVVDGAAEVEVRGDTALLRNLSGQPPQWRRFECTSVMPQNPVDFRFAGVDGRGRQQLVGDPRNGGVAVVRIEDPASGAEGYTFRLTWRTNGYPAGQVNGPNYRERVQPDQDVYHNQRDRFYRSNNWRPQFFQRIRDDLNHAAAITPPFGGDRNRLERTNFELDELQQKLSRGFYDEQELDEVMGALQAVVNNNRLTARDRAILTDDLDRMRDFRLRHDQYGARDQEGVYHQQREQAIIGANWRALLFQHVREDLDHVAASTFPFGGDQARLARTKYELDELQQKLARGYYDEQELDEVIGALDVVLSSNRLASRDRDVLADDLVRLRDFRVRHDQYGAR